MSGFLKVLGGALVVVAIFAGWWAIDRAQEHLPGPINAVIDSVQNGGMPGAGPLVQPLPDTGPRDPLEGCPEFAEDVRTAENAIANSASISQAQVDANNELIAKEAKRILGGGAGRPLQQSGVAAALTDQADALDAMATGLSGAQFRTGEAQSLATGVTTAARRAAEANRTFVAQAAGTRAQWEAWMDAVGGPMAQADAASKGFTKCPA